MAIAKFKKQPAESKFASQASLYASTYGWRVFPLHDIVADGEACSCSAGAACPKIGKHPRVKSWQNVATVDEKQIKEWWTNWPNAGIGIATGKDSNLSVLDVDVRNGGDITLSKLTSKHEIPSDAGVVVTGGGGWHYYFAYTSALGTRAEVLGPGLDTRSDGGFVVAPPSGHSSGKAYEWGALPKPGSTLASWPIWLMPEDKKETRGRPRKEKFNPKAPQEVASLKHALKYVDHSSYDSWIRVGFALGRAFGWGEEGWKIYEEWASLAGAKYDAKKSRTLYFKDSRKHESPAGKNITIASIFEEASHNPEYIPLDVDPDRVVVIYDDPTSEDKVLEETIAALKHPPNCFQKDGMLVRVVTYDIAPDSAMDFGIERDRDAYIIRGHDAGSLAVELTPFVSWRMMNGKTTRINRQTTSDVVKWGMWPGCKVLRTFVAHPTLRSDGTAITKRGYDETTGMYLAKEIEGIEINSNMSSSEAAKAVTLALSPFNEFSFRGSGRVAFASCLWTIGVRHLFPTAPLFALAAPRRGSGKTLLAEAANRFWFGTSLSKSNFTRDREEMEKRISAFLLAGDRLVCFDNVPAGVTVNDPTLNLVLTSHRANFRILGKTERVQLSNESTWIVTGNNLRISGDIVRRTILVYIDPDTDRPETRLFKIHNLEQHIVGRRKELIGASLSAFSSFLTAHGGVREIIKNDANNNWGGFDVWWRVMRKFTEWSGIGDLSKAREGVSSEDDESEYDCAFIKALDQFVFMGDKTTWVGTSEITTKIRSTSDLRAAFNSTFASSLADVSIMIGEVEPSLRTVGMLLHRLQNNVFPIFEDAKVKLVKSKSTTASKWKLIEGGENGEEPSDEHL